MESIKAVHIKSNPGWITYTLRCKRCGRKVDVTTNRGLGSAIEENKCNRIHEGDLPSPVVKKIIKKEVVKNDNKRTLRNKTSKRYSRKKS